MGRAELERSNTVDGMRKQSILCELTCDASWRLPEITEQDFEGGWSPALAGRGMSQ